MYSGITEYDSIIYMRHICYRVCEKALLISVREGKEVRYEQSIEAVFEKNCYSYVGN